MQNALAADTSGLFAELESISADMNTIREQLVVLDENAESGRSERETLLESIGDLVQELETVQAEMGKYKSQFGKQESDMEENKLALSRLEAQLRRQRSNHDHVLAMVEQQLGDVLTEFDLNQ